MIIPGVKGGDRCPDEWTQSLYQTIEEWWGEELSPSLAAKASQAPGYQLRRFLEDLADQSLVYKGSPQLSPMAAGILRPLVSSNVIEPTDWGSSGAIALRLLLYSHEVAIQSEPIVVMLATRHEPINELSRWTVRHVLAQLSNFRPFVFNGILHFTPVHSPARHPAFSGWERDVLANADVRQQALDLAAYLDIPSNEVDDLLLRSLLMHFFTSLKMGLMRMAAGKANLLVRADSERKLLRALLTPAVDQRRQAAMSTLAQLTVPDFTSDPKLLIALRNSDEEFNAWRQKLAGALSYVGELSDSVDLAVASSIVKTELTSALSEVNASTQKSPVLSAAHSGFIQFGVGAIGAVSTGIATGNPIAAGVMGAASTQLTTFVINSIKGLQTRRSDRLVLALAASFERPSN